MHDQKQSIIMAEDSSNNISFDSFKSQRDGNIKDDSFCNDFVQAGKGLLDVTFESDIFEFSVTDSTAIGGANNLPRSSSWFPDFSSLVEPTAVDVAIHEQMAATYDDFAQNGAITVKGSIYIRTAATTFEVTIHDDSKNIQRIEPIESICKQRKDKTSAGTLKVELKSTSPKDEILIANYFCSPKLRPVPLLVKNRVSATKGFARVGFKIRANPSNEVPLINLVTIIAVPPDVDGGHCKMSRKGGSWDDLKRTLTWSISSLAPGEAVEIQAQFPFVEEQHDRSCPKFPVLVQCDCAHTFSKVRVTTRDDTLRINSNMSGLVIHRKV